MTKKEGWKIYYNSKHYKSEWEHPQKNAGLLLPKCAYCEHPSTRETFVKFWKEFFTLIQNYSIVGIAKCPKCFQWNAYCC